MVGIAKNLKGKTYGNLTVLERFRLPPPPPPPKYAFWRCECTCGQVVVKRGDQLRQGQIKSCCIDGHRYKKPPRKPRDILS